MSADLKVATHYRFQAVLEIKIIVNLMITITNDQTDDIIHENYSANLSCIEPINGDKLKPTTNLLIFINGTFGTTTVTSLCIKRFRLVWNFISCLGNELRSGRIMHVVIWLMAFSCVLYIIKEFSQLVANKEGNQTSSNLKRKYKI